MTAILLSSNRDRVKLQEGGYLYVFDKLSTNGEKKFWRCERKSECNARIHTDALTNVVVKRASEHNHPSHLELTPSGAILSGAKRRAYEPIEDISQLENSQARLVREAYLLPLNHPDAMQKMAQRTQRKLSVPENGAHSPSLIANGYLNDRVSGEESMTVLEEGIGSGTDRDAKISSKLSVKDELYAQHHAITPIRQSMNERLENITANAIASSTAVASCSSSTPVIAHAKARKATPHINVLPIGADKYMTGGFVCWSERIPEIVTESEMVANMVAHSPNKPFASILFTEHRWRGTPNFIQRFGDHAIIRDKHSEHVGMWSGKANTGKSCLAAMTTKSVETSLVRLCSSDDVVALNELAKVAALRKVLEDTYSTAVNVVMLDNIDRIIDYCPVGPKYSNFVLQTILVLLKKAPPPNHRLLVIATASDDCARAFDLQQFFTTVLEVPSLTSVDHIMAVVEDSNTFAEAECRKIRTRLAEKSQSYSVGIKTLLDLLELTKQRDAASRMEFICTRIERLTG